MKNDVTHAIQLKLHERMNKKQNYIGDCDVMWSQQTSCWRNKKTESRPMMALAIALRLLKT